MADGIYQKREFDMLAKRMVRRDGYTLERPGGSGGAFVIKKLGKCDVRVVLRDSVVSKGDVAGFERDVALSGGHGIMCTREGKVPGRCSVDFRRLSTGRFVWYVSEIGDNADAVVVFTRALYGMDERSAKQSQATAPCASRASGASGASGSATSGGASGSCASGSGASATSGGASGSATSGDASGSATSAERLKRACQTAEIAWAKKVMKTQAEKIVEAKATTAKMIMILADVEQPPSAERGAEGCDRGSTSKIT